MSQPSNVSVESRPTNLGLIFQEVLTVIVRLRSNRQNVSDSESFRQVVRAALTNATHEARNAGYAVEDIKTATFAVVGFLDESVLSSQNHLFQNWPGRTLQEELFRTHMAGQIFFENLQQLLGKPDSTQLADLLEVHYLCLLLGYRGQYSARGEGELKSIMQATADKIHRIRGPLTGFSRSWQLKDEAAPARKDTKTRTFLYAAVGCFLLALILFIGFKLTLDSGARQIQASASQSRS